MGTATFLGGEIKNGFATDLIAILFLSCWWVGGIVTADGEELVGCEWGWATWYALLYSSTMIMAGHLFL